MLRVVGRSDSVNGHDEADGGGPGRLDEPAATGRDRLSADRRKKGRWTAASACGLLRYYYRDAA